MDTLVIPVALDIPSALTFIRTTLISIIAEYDITIGGIRIIEGNSKTKDTFRMNIEGVVQEMFANSTVDKYYCGTISSLAKLLGKKQTEITVSLSSKEPLSGFEVEGWNKFKKEEKEGILFSLAALNI
ncbi:hypothetical protein [Ferdinandcohnia sp. SAFN-114]|uniref:hypothetical protein n=1 Tax=Ferdinandcohnia sp. SAFN-114 TaxID=3387275 RepID=UPI003F7DEB93